MAGYFLRPLCGFSFTRLSPRLHRFARWRIGRFATCYDGTRAALPRTFRFDERFSKEKTDMAGVPHFGQGWLGDLPDPRDFTSATAEIRAALGKLPRRRSARSSLPTTVDLREFC